MTRQRRGCQRATWLSPSAAVTRRDHVRNLDTKNTSNGTLLQDPAQTTTLLCGHIESMERHRQPHQALCARLHGTRLTGRLKLRWVDLAVSVCLTVCAASVSLEWRTWPDYVVSLYVRDTQTDASCCPRHAPLRGLDVSQNSLRTAAQYTVFQHTSTFLFFE